MLAHRYADPERFEDPLENYEPKVYPSEVERSLDEGQVAEIPMTPFAEISADLTVRHAVYALYGLKLASLLVVDQRSLVGLFTERDVLERVAESFEKVADRPIRELMTRDPIVIHEDDPPAAALSVIAAGGYRHVPVLNSAGKPVGVVSPRRLFRFLEQQFAAELAVG